MWVPFEFFNYQSLISMTMYNYMCVYVYMCLILAWFWELNSILIPQTTIRTFHGSSLIRTKERLVKLITINFFHFPIDFRFVSIMFAWESWIVDFITQNLKTFIVNFFRFLLNIRAAVEWNLWISNCRQKKKTSKCSVVILAVVAMGI